MTSSSLATLSRESNCLKKSKRGKILLSYDNIKSVLHLSQKEASVKLGVSVSTLKRRQSELKISWPRRLTDKGSKKRGDSSVYDDESIDSSFEESSNLESDLFKSSSSSDTDASILIRETKSESSTPAFEESPSPRERQFQFIVPPVVDASQIPENFVLPYYGGDSRFNMGFSFELSMLTNEFFQNMKDELFNMYKEWEHRQRCNTNI